MGAVNAVLNSLKGKHLYLGCLVSFFGGVGTVQFICRVISFSELQNRFECLGGNGFSFLVAPCDKTVSFQLPACVEGLWFSSPIRKRVLSAVDSAHMHSHFSLILDAMFS